MKEQLKVVNYSHDLLIINTSTKLPCYVDNENNKVFWWKDVRDLCGIYKTKVSSDFIRGISLDENEYLKVRIGKMKKSLNNQHGGLRKNTEIAVFSGLGLLKILSNKTGYDNTLVHNIANTLFDKQEIEKIHLNELNYLKNNYRDEIKFFKQLKQELEWWKEDYIYSYTYGDMDAESIKNAQKSYSENVICCNDIVLKFQKPVCNNKYKIDCYIPEYNIAIEYDEDYHRYYKDEDKKRELEISEYIMVEEMQDVMSQYADYQSEFPDVVDYINYRKDSCFTRDTYIEFIRVNQGNERRMIQFIKNRIMYKYL